LQQLALAGELQIAFTTGLLLGIEKQKGLVENLGGDRTPSSTLGTHSRSHPATIQSRKSADLGCPAFDPHCLPEVIAIAREILTGHYPANSPIWSKIPTGYLPV